MKYRVGNNSRSKKKKIRWNVRIVYVTTRRLVSPPEVALYPRTRLRLSSHRHTMSGLTTTTTTKTTTTSVERHGERLLEIGQDLIGVTDLKKQHQLLRGATNPNIVVVLSSPPPPSCLCSPFTSLSTRQDFSLGYNTRMWNILADVSTRF